MKKLILTFCSVILATTLHAQLEFSEGVNTGLFHYSGSGAAFDTYILASSPNRTNNPYGHMNGLSYGAYAQLQYVTKGGFIMGVQSGYDLLRSKVKVTGIVNEYYYYAPYVDYIQDASVQDNATGYTYLQSELINVNPYIGYRIKATKVNIDLIGGIDLGFHINSYDKGSATFTDASAGMSDTTDYNLGKAKTDVRLRFGTAISYKRWILNVSYAHGLTKYLPYLYTEGSGDYVHTELLRMGISYRIK